MACRLASTSHYLNQCWNSVNWTLGSKLQWNLNRNLHIFIQENTFENVVWKWRPLCFGLYINWTIVLLPSKAFQASEPLVMIIRQSGQQPFNFSCMCHNTESSSCITVHIFIKAFRYAHPYLWFALNIYHDSLQSCSHPSTHDPVSITPGLNTLPCQTPWQVTSMPAPW